ncbi:MAG: ubiquinone/menaquinone biosynthesis methyltransferase [Chloroflexi bacterium]|nr:ubiquinone/menaquinone biosynthesis methyltransferase [Chloroflexota bacterium]
MTEAHGKPLQRLFSDITPRYDLINRIITLGLDQRWRCAAARECLSSRPQKMLDLGCGTGDLTICLARLAPNGAAITGLDYSQPMLAIGRQKAHLLRREEAVTFVHSDAAALPFPDSHLDAVCIAFAFRNLTYRNLKAAQHLSEVHRVLCPGGRLVIVETSQPDNQVIRRLFHTYLRWLAAPLGRLLSGNRGAYRYLAESAVHFYTREEVRTMLAQTGFRKVTYRRLLFGTIALHVATK